MGSEKPFLIHLWRGLQEQFGRGSSFCDVILFDHSESPRIQTIPCHSVVLMSISSFFHKLLLNHAPRKDIPICISLPKEISFLVMKNFLKILYNKLCYSDLGSELLEIPASLVGTLCIDIVTNRLPLSEKTKKIRTKTINRYHLSACVDVQGFIPRLGRFICPFECGELFKSPFTLNIHLKNHHQPSSFMCEECGAEKESSESLKSHQSMIHKEQQCKECSIILSGRYALKKHVELIHSQRVQCAHCTKDFMSKKYLRKHILSVHAKEEDKIFNCTHCSKKFAHSSILKHHLDYCDPRVEIESCPICGKLFKFEYLLRRHLIAVHEGSMNGPLPQFECDLCFQLFATKDLLLHHKEQIHTPDEILSVICKQCNKKFPSIENYEDHDVVNHGERPYPCAECSDTIKTRPSLKLHMLFKHKSRSFSFCKICGKRFNSLSSYKSHRLHAHSIDPKIRYKIICHICQKQFQSEYDLETHFKSCSHTSPSRHKMTALKGQRMKKYPCKFCSRGFMQYSQLHTHLRSQHSIKMPSKKLKCNYCAQTFVHSSLLNLHLKSNHTHKRITTCNSAACSFVSLNRRSFIEHTAFKHSIGMAFRGEKYPCSICKKALSSEALRRIHMEQFHLKDERMRGELSLPDDSFSLLQEIKIDINQSEDNFLILTEH